jgi:polysaccharide pyruvyl transferase WcaK-like protein
VIDAQMTSAEELLLELVTTDLVVATRFHNVLLALLLGKPVISISFHQKCASLMEEMGLSEYSLDIEHLRADELIERFQKMKDNAETLKAIIEKRSEEMRQSLEGQFESIFAVRPNSEMLAV